MKSFILITFSYDILDIHVILSSIVNAIWMKTCTEKTTSAFLLSHYRLLIKCTINIWLQLFTRRIWSNILLLQSISSRLGHLVIDFLVAKDKISSSILSNNCDGPYIDTYKIRCIVVMNFFYKINLYAFEKHYCHLPQNMSF